MKTKILAITATAWLAFPAYAVAHTKPHTWWLMDGNSDTCKNTLTLPWSLQSPYNTREVLRSRGPEHTSVHHMPDHAGLMVFVHGYHNSEPVLFDFFSTQRGCDMFLKGYKQYVPNLNELK